jgi:hypothetical protein
MNSVFKVMFKIWLLEEMILWVSNVFLCLFDPLSSFGFFGDMAYSSSSSSLVRNFSFFNIFVLICHD